jgi:hypothetical protein
LIQHPDLFPLAVDAADVLGDPLRELQMQRAPFLDLALGEIPFIGG